MSSIFLVLQCWLNSISQENNIHATRYTQFETEDLNISFELKSSFPSRQTIYVQYSLQLGFDFTDKVIFKRLFVHVSV